MRRRPRPPLRGGCTGRRAPSAPSSTTCSRPRPPRRPCLRRGGRRGFAPPSASASEDERRRAEVLLALGTALFRAGPLARRDPGVPRGGRDRARGAATESCSRGRRSGSRTPAGARAPGPGCARAAGGGVSPRSKPSDSRLRVAASGGPRPRARVPGRAARARRWFATAPSRWPAGSTTGAGSRTVLMGAYWARGTTQPRETILDDARRGARPRRAARRHRGAGRGDGVADRRADGARRDRAARRASWRSRSRMAAAHAAAVHPPRRRALPIGAGAARGPARGCRGARRSARASGAGC